MSTLTDVIQRPATAALELERLRARVAELERMLDIAEDTVELLECDINEGKFSATCLACGSKLEHVRPGKWQCNTCEARRFDTTWLYDGEGLSEEES